jgi:hypothetical protein
MVFSLKKCGELRQAKIYARVLWHPNNPARRFVVGGFRRPVANVPPERLQIMFLPGQKVVCVNDHFPLGIERYFPSLPKEGQQYIIRDIVPGIGPRGGEGEIAVYLVEIIGSINDHGIERGFNAERFAPLQTDEDELEQVREDELVLV